MNASSWKHTLSEALSQSGFRKVGLFRHEYGQIMARYWNDMYAEFGFNGVSLTILTGI